MSKQDWFEYAELCGWVLARAHARTGDPAQIAGYLGKNQAFDEAIAKFAAAYADQTERDHAALLKAIRAGHIQARSSGA
jgi:NAD(P)H-dependent flavin oxidoreductase YrpB (nitropropane dioxygenase family)